MKYAADTMQMENDDLLERPGDWDSLSDRMRKMRRPHNKTAVQHPKGTLIHKNLYLNNANFANFHF